MALKHHKANLGTRIRHYRIDKTVFRQMPTSQEVSQEIPDPWAKIVQQNYGGGGKFSIQIMEAVVRDKQILVSPD